MAHRGIAAGSLALLTLAALLHPLAAADLLGTAAAPAPPTGSITARTTATAYALGEPVVVVVHDNDTSGAPVNVTAWRLRLLAPGGELLLPFPALNASLADHGLLLPGGDVNLTWNTTGAAPGTYHGDVQMPSGDAWVPVASIDGGSGWTLQAPPPPAALRLATAAAWPAGSPVNLLLANDGPGALASPSCDARLTVRSASGTVLLDAALAAPCQLASGDAVPLAWDGRDGDQPAAPGSYRAEAAYGGRAANASFTVEPAEPSPPPGTRALALRVSPSAAPGEAVRIALLNTGTLDIQGALALRITDAAGFPAYTRTDNVTLILPANATFEVLWDQRGAAGQAVPPGAYRVSVDFAGLRASGTVEAGAAPPTPAVQPGVPAPATSVVGGFDAPRAAGPADYTGSYVRFRAAAGRLENITVGDSAVLTLGGVPDVPPRLEPGSVAFAAAGAEVRVFDTPTPSVRVVTQRAASPGLLWFAPGLALHAAGSELTFDGPGVHGVLALLAPGTVRLQGTRGVWLDFDADVAASGFVVRIAPGPAASAESDLPKAIAGNKVAAEAYIAPGPEPRVSVVPYVGQARVQVLGADAGALRLRVDVDEHEGRVLVFHLGDGVLNADAQHVRVRLDGEDIAPADNITDVLNPDDDGLHAEFAVVAAAQGLDVLVSVPHFSAHDLSIESTLAQVARGLGPYGLLAGFALALVAGAAMLRRRP